MCTVDCSHLLEYNYRPNCTSSTSDHNTSPIVSSTKTKTFFGWMSWPHENKNIEYLTSFIFYSTQLLPNYAAFLVLWSLPVEYTRTKLNPNFVFFDCFPSFLHFIISFIHLLPTADWLTQSWRSGGPMVFEAMY